MMMKETTMNEKWISFKDQLDKVLEMKGQFYSATYDLLSPGEVFMFGNKRNFCLEPNTPSLFLSYPSDQFGEKESRLITLAIKREWERRIGYLDRSKEMFLQRVLLGIYEDQDVKWLNQIGLSEKEAYIPMSVRFRNQVSDDELLMVEVGLTSYFGHQVFLIRSGDNYACLLPVERIHADEKEDSSHWSDLGYSILELLEAELNLETRIAFSPPVKGFAFWGSGFRSASRALQVGLQMYPENRIFFSWEMAIELFLHLIPNDIAQPFLSSVWGNWGQENMNPEWVKLVRTLVQENLNISQTAKKMYVHRNTLMYRMEKFKAETGRDLRTTEDAFPIYLATLLNCLNSGAQIRDK